MPTPCALRSRSQLSHEFAHQVESSLQQAGKDPKKVVIGGVDATRDALAEMEKGNLAVTVFQDAKGQGKAVVESAQKLLKKEKFESPYVYVPFELVTKENYKEYLKKL
jgi:inositol transport system substrate-binding protein